MKERCRYLAGYLLFWFIYFLFFKAVFLMYHAGLSRELDRSTLAGIFLYGSQLDLAFTVYISAIPILLVALSSIDRLQKWISTGLLFYTNFMLIFMTILCTTDLELFRIWGFRLDNTPLMYLNTPTEMMASVGSSPIVLMIILNSVVNIFFFFAYKKLLHPLSKEFPAQKGYTFPVYSLAIVILFISLGDGLQLTPNNLRKAYFSNTLFANQAAVNVPWNFFYSIHKSKTKDQNPYIFMDAPLADSLTQSLYPGQETMAPKVLHTNRPNIVLIIWESFTAKAAEGLGGLAGITPSFHSLSGEGLLFSRLYASGDRSDKGLVAILSGYPSQPTTSILNTPEKARALPQLARTLGNEGYETSFYYGGELEFANLDSYLLNSGFQERIGVEKFDKNQLNSKWGAHDHVVFNRLLQDIDQQQKKKGTPFFKTIFTLSSHEPFDIPVAPKFKEKEVTSRFLSALHYTDSTIGQFVAEAKKRSWYENTLFIIIADHGHTYPGNTRVSDSRKFHIPMLWFGGALETDPGVIAHTMSQTDLAASLLGQLHIPATDFNWSKNILNPQSPHFAHYFFKDGVGFVTDSSALSFDNVGRKIIEKQGASDSTQLNLARAYLQLSYGDYLNK